MENKIDLARLADTARDVRRRLTEASQEIRFGIARCVCGLQAMTCDTTCDLRDKGRCLGPEMRACARMLADALKCEAVADSSPPRRPLGKETTER